MGGGPVISGLVWQVAASWFMSGEEECPHFFAEATNYLPPALPLSPPHPPTHVGPAGFIGPSQHLTPRIYSGGLRCPPVYPPPSAWWLKEGLLGVGGGGGC